MTARLTTCAFIATCLTLASAAHAATFFASAAGSGNCSSWTSTCTLTQAIEAADIGDVVLVHSGTYGPLTLKNGVKVIGGFAGSEEKPWQSDPVANETIIDGGGERAVVSDDNASSTVLSGFTIRNGQTTSTDGGGGLKLKDSSAVFIRCVFRTNSASQAGGAVAIRGSGSPQFINCKFYDNGGGQGEATARGGAVLVDNGTPSFLGCLFHNNSATKGGGVFVNSGQPTFINCTISQNHATDGSGGGVHDAEGRSTVRNSILWANTASGDGQQIYNDPEMDGTVLDSVVQGGWLGDATVDTDPLFVSASNRDFHLQGTSPCKDHGRMSAVPPDIADVDFDNNVQEPVPVDLDFKARVSGPEVDMGAYEFQVGGS